MKNLNFLSFVIIFLSIIFASATFSQNSQYAMRPSCKTNEQLTNRPDTTLDKENTTEERKFHLSAGFYSDIKKNAVQDDIDTLNYPLAGTYSIYIPTSTEGYVTGNNGYGDIAKANKFMITEACQVTGILFYFFHATGGPVDIEIAVWNNGGENNSPGEVIGSTMVPLTAIQNNISNGQMSYIAFDEPITVTTTFYAGMLLPTAPGDTLVVWSNTDGDITPGIAWEQWDNGSWHAMFSGSSWGLDLALAIFPIVDYGPLPLMADFMASSTHIQPGESVVFTDLSTGNPTSRLWTFEGGDPATSTEPNLAVYYFEEGTFDVTLTVENDTAQDTKTIEDYITVTASTIEIDTLNYPLEGDYAVYLTEGNAYVSGNNEYGDLAKANYFHINENLYITGILNEFYLATGGGSSIEFAIWDNDGEDSSPGSKIAFQIYPFDDIFEDIAAENFTYVPFDPPVLVDGPFYAGFMLPTAPGDTLVVYSNHDGDTEPGIAWELWDTNEWYPFSTSWPLDMALAIYPIVQNTLEINENTFPNRLYIYPNPSEGQYNIEVPDFRLQSGMLNVYNASGICVVDKRYNNKGDAPLIFDLTSFPNGIYMVRLMNGRFVYQEKVIKK